MPKLIRWTIFLIILNTSSMLLIMQLHFNLYYMKNFILILSTAFALIGCSSNPIKNTQWEVVPNTLDEISLISFGNDDCTFYMKSSLNGNTTTAKFGYKVNDNVITFSPIDVFMESYPTLIIDGEFLIFEKTKLPTFKKVK